MSTKLGTAYVPIEGDWSRFNRSVATHSKGLGAGFAKLGSDLGSKLAHGATTAAKVGLAGVAGGFVFAIKKAADFEQQLSSLKSVTSANADQLGRLRSQALKAGADTKFSALEAAQAQTELAKGGLSVKQIMGGGLKSALALAAAGELNLADAASTTVNAMKLFNLRGADSMKVADGLATAANVTTADVSDFRLALAQAGSAAKTSGLNFGETVTALETLAEVGVKGSDAGTSLKTMLLQLASPTSLAAVDTADKLGIHVFDAAGNMKSLVDVSATLQKGLGGLTRQQRIQAATTLVGQDGFRALLALYDAGPKKIAKYEKQLDKSGTAAQVAKTKQDNLKGSLENFKGSIETLAISVGTHALPTLRHLTTDLTGFANTVGRVLDRKDLTFAQKVNRIFDVAKVDAKPWIDKIKTALDHANIPEHLSHAFETTMPKVVDAIAKLAPKAAGKFVAAFMNAGPWGRLLAGGFLLAKMGGVGAFTKVGRDLGAAIAAGATTSTPAFAVVGAKAGAAMGAAAVAGWERTTGGGLLFTGFGPAAAATAGAKAGAAMGASMAPAVSRAAGWKAAATRIGTSIGGPIALAAAFVFGPEFIKKVQEDVSTTTIVGDKVKFKLPKDIVLPLEPGFLKGFAKTVLGVVEPAKQEMRNFGETAEGVFRKLNGQNTKEAVAQLTTLATRARGYARQFPVFAKEFGTFASAAEAAAKRSSAALGRQWAGQIAGNFRNLTRSGRANMAAIRTTVQTNTQIIRDRLGKDTEAGRKAAARNFRLAAKVIDAEMHAGVISTRNGTKQMRAYLAKALKALGLTQARAKALQRTGTLLNSDDRPGRSTIGRRPTSSKTQAHDRAVEKAKAKARARARAAEKAPARARARAVEKKHVEKAQARARARLEAPPKKKKAHEHKPHEHATKTKAHEPKTKAHDKGHEKKGHDQSKKGHERHRTLVRDNIDTLNVKRLVVAHAKGLADSTETATERRRRRRGTTDHRRGHTTVAAENAAQRAEERHRKQQKKKHDDAVARAKVKAAPRLSTLDTVGQFDDVDLANARQFARTLRRSERQPVFKKPKPEKPISDGGSPAVGRMHGPVTVHQTFNVTGVHDETHLRARLGREAEKRVRRALTVELERRGG